MSTNAPRAHRLPSYGRAVYGVAAISFASGFGQFSIVAALASVANAFSHHHGTLSVAEQAGLSGTSLGIGLAIIRLTSLVALPITASADRVGRRRVLVGACALGLACTVASSLSPTYWFFIAIFALGRPFLTTVNSLSLVTVAENAEETRRAGAVAVVSAGYALGAGISAIVHSLFPNFLGFRGVFLLAGIPLLALPKLARIVPESRRFVASGGHVTLRGSTVVFRGGLARRLVVLVVVFFAISVITGPADSFVFLYAQHTEHLASSSTAAMVAAAGPIGLGGLLLGRLLADHAGRRFTIALSMVAMASFGVLAYSGGRLALVVGYELGICSSALLAPAGGAYLTELFPTRVRGAATGWQVVAGVLGATLGLVTFGVVAGSHSHFALAAVVTFVPAVAATVLLGLLPETRDRVLADLDAQG